MNDVRLKAKQAVHGALDALFPYLTLALVLVTLFSLSPLGRDDTDGRTWGARSGVVPRTDARTGCQYLETSGGGITPRLDGSGRHVGCGGAK